MGALDRLGPGQSPVTYQEWDSMVSRFRMRGRTRQRLEWDECQGAGRGYSCGLWTLFHTLVMAAKDAPQALRAIRGYMAAFFKCEECAQHFAQEANTLESHAKDHASSNLWLWQAHNKVNRRTGPRYGVAPGVIEYPTYESCPGCHKDGKWVDSEVLQYLVRVYSPDGSSPPSLGEEL